MPLVRIDITSRDYPHGLEIRVDGRILHHHDPRAKQQPIDATGWAEAAFDPPPYKNPNYDLLVETTRRWLQAHRDDGRVVAKL